MALPPVPVGSASLDVVTFKLIACTLDDRARKTMSIALPPMLLDVSELVTVITLGTPGLLV